MTVASKKIWNRADKMFQESDHQQVVKKWTLSVCYSFNLESECPSNGKFNKCCQG